ncbi:MAG: mevalonate kinase [Candidatus Woesearchaeota archaeon]
MGADAHSEGIALARAALAGNPSDGYAGAVLAVTLPAWRARAEAAPGAPAGVEPANALVQATVDRFARVVDRRAAGSHVRWSTSIPQQVGLASSSALVIAVTRALCGLHRAELSPERLAEFALAVETEELGFIAGLQDRLTQAYEGLLFMDFSDPPAYEPLDHRLLPPLLIAWHEQAAAPSGDVHGELRRRYRQGDSGVRKVMGRLALAARGARTALVEHDLGRFAQCMNDTFELRRQLMPLDPLCVEMVGAAQAAGASANYTGSGGAIVAACHDESHALETERALTQLGCGVGRG